MAGISAEGTICNREINHAEMMEVIPRADLQQADGLQQVGPEGWVVQGGFVLSCVALASSSLWQLEEPNL